jgi:hypothetical protein
MGIIAAITFGGCGRTELDPGIVNVIQNPPPAPPGFVPTCPSTLCVDPSTRFSYPCDLVGSWIGPGGEIWFNENGVIAIGIDASGGNAYGTWLDGCWTRNGGELVGVDDDGIVILDSLILISGSTLLIESGPFVGYYIKTS